MDDDRLAEHLAEADELERRTLGFASSAAPPTRDPEAVPARAGRAVAPSDAEAELRELVAAPLPTVDELLGSTAEERAAAEDVMRRDGTAGAPDAHRTRTESELLEQIAAALPSERELLEHLAELLGVDPPAPR